MLSPEEKYLEAEDAFFSTISKLSDQERAQFFDVIKNITEDQKEDILSRLVNKN